jgi:hypothetical protein
VAVDSQGNPGPVQSTTTGTHQRGSSDDRADTDPPQLKKRKSGPVRDATTQPVNGRARQPVPEDCAEPSMGDTIRGALLFVDEDDTIFEPPPIVVPWRGQTQGLPLRSQPYSSRINITHDAYDILHTMNSITPDFFNVGKSTDLSSLDPSVPIVINTPSPFSEAFSEHCIPIPRGPSMEFAKETWWDNLLDYYSDDPHHSAKKILQDLHFLSV